MGNMEIKDIFKDKILSDLNEGGSYQPKKFGDLKVKSVEEIGKVYGQQLKDVAKKNKLGSYLGYTVSIKDRHILVVGTNGWAKVWFDLSIDEIGILHK